MKSRPLTIVLFAACLLIFAGSSFAGTGLTAGTGTTSRYIYWTNNTGAPVAVTSYNSANGAVWGQSTVQPGVTIEAAYQGRDNTSQPWRTPSLYLKKTSDGSYIFGPEIYAAWDAQGIVPNVEYVPTPPPTPTPTPIPTPTPAPTDVADSFSGDIGDGMPAGFLARVKLTFPDGHVRWVDVGPDGTFNYPYYISEIGQTVEREVYVYRLNAEDPSGVSALPVNTFGWGTDVVPDITASWTADVPQEVVLPPPPSQFDFQNVGSVVSQSGQVTPVVSVSGGSAGTTVTSPGTSAAPTLGINGVVRGTGASGSFVSGEAPSENHGDLTDVKNLLREGNIQREIARQQEVSLLSGIASALDHPVTSPTLSVDNAAVPAGEDFSALGAEALAEVDNISAKFAAIRGSMQTLVPAAPAVSDSYGQTLVMHVTLPGVFGAMTLDASPYATSIGAFRGVCTFVLGVISWLWYVRILRGAFV